VADLVFSTRALGTLRSIRSWLGRRNPDAADRVIEEIERACALLREQPMMGRAIPDTTLRQHVTRRYRYRVIYRVSEDVVEVRAVLHPSRSGAESGPG
jgi:plasmid stabilization system protein ParE